MRYSECSASLQKPRWQNPEVMVCRMSEQRPILRLVNFSPCFVTLLLLRIADVASFSAQRNTYLTGFCLFLSMILTRTFYIILDLIHTQGEYAKLKQVVSISLMCFDLWLTLYRLLHSREKTSSMKTSQRWLQNSKQSWPPRKRKVLILVNSNDAP